MQARSKGEFTVQLFATAFPVMDRYIVMALFLMLVVSTTAAQLAATSHPKIVQSSQESGKPVARINGTVLTEFDLQREMAMMFPYAQQHGGKVPKSMEPEVRRGALQMIEFEELVYQEALRRKMQIGTARLDQALTDLRAQFESETAFQQFLKAEFHATIRISKTGITRFRCF